VGGGDDQPAGERFLRLGVQRLRDDRQGRPGVPDRLRERLPRNALVSLHYYFPWAIEALVAWCIFCMVTGRAMRINQSTGDYFEIADRDDLGYDEKLSRYRELADAYLQKEEFEEFRATVLPHLRELTVEYVESPEFDELIVQCVRLEVETKRQEEMIERSRSSVGACAADQSTAARG